MRTKHFIIGAVAGIVLLGCDPPQTSTPPLAPLVYTELPDITPEAAEVRERRLKRQLTAGGEDEKWGALAEPKPPPPATTVEAVGRRLVEALLKHDESAWDQTFISAQAYTDLVHVEPLEAARFVDEIRGQSESVWRLFRPPPESEVVNGGFEKVFAFRSVHPGSARTLAGKTPEEGETPGQYWNAVISLEYLPDPSLVLELKIPKIVRAPGPQGGLVVASKVVADPRLRVLLRAGLHLKTELLRNNEYPFPLKVGNYWKFRRRYDVEPEKLDGMPMLDGSERLYEVTSVDLLGAMRVVRIDRSLNDSALHKEKLVWLVTPRQIVACDRKCRRTLTNLNETLDYIAMTKPIFRFPLEMTGDGRAIAEIASLEMPAGEFRSVVQLKNDSVISSFAVGRGVVQRSYEELGYPVVEELVDFRLVP